LDPINKIPLEKKNVSVGLHAELHKFGNVESRDIQNAQEEYQVKTVGMKLSITQKRALFAVQIIMCRKISTGEISYKDVYDDVFSFTGSIPSMKIKPAEFLDAYGAKRIKTKRGSMEFSGEERRQAMKALYSLKETKYLFVYKRKYWTEKGIEQIDRIQTYSSLIKIIDGWQALSISEDSSLDRAQNTAHSDRKKVIIIKLSAILIDQIDSFYMLKSPSHYLNIKKVSQQKSIYVYSFIDWLFIQAEFIRRNKKRAWVIEINEIKLAKTLRMDSYLKNRKMSKVKSILKKCFDDALELKFLRKVDFRSNGQSKITLYLNKEEFIHDT